MKRQEFEEAALPHLNDIYRTAARLLADSAKADDVVQDVYLQAWKSFDRFEVGTNCRAWLYKILFHVVQHHRRKWFNARVVKDSEEFLDIAVAHAAPILEHLTDARSSPRSTGFRKIFEPWYCWSMWKSSLIRKHPACWGCRSGP